MYQPLHPAVLRMVRDVVQVGRQAGISVAMCGEMAGDPLYIPVLLGLGVEEFSMNAMAIPVVKRVIRMTSLEEATEIARKALLLAYRGRSQRLRHPGDGSPLSGHFPVRPSPGQQVE